jgi:hypothetical protein
MDFIAAHKNAKANRLYEAEEAGAFARLHPQYGVIDNPPSQEFQHVITVKIPCGPPGGEDDYDVEVLLNCAYDGETVHAEPFQHRHPVLGKQAPWVPFILGTLNGDGYIHVRAQDWIDDHEDELLEVARNLISEGQ